MSLADYYQKYLNQQKEEKTVTSNTEKVLLIDGL